MGSNLYSYTSNKGLNIILADNTVEAGIFDVYERLTTGRLKVFNTCTKLLEEYRLYRRDEKGKIVKQHDHIMDALRYLVQRLQGTVDVKRAPVVSKPPK
jgi:hypothetical protein